MSLSRLFILLTSVLPPSAVRVNCSKEGNTVTRLVKGACCNSQPHSTPMWHCLTGSRLPAASAYKAKNLFAAVPAFGTV